MPFPPNEIQIVPGVVFPDVLLNKIDDLLKEPWTKRELDTGRTLPILAIIREYMSVEEFPNSTLLTTELEYLYTKYKWKVELRGGKTATFKVPSTML